MKDPAVYILMIIMTIGGFFYGCATKSTTPVFRDEIIMGKRYHVADPESFETLQDCIDSQVELFHDLCAESSVGYEEMDGTDAFYEGVKCATNGIKLCGGYQ